MTTTRPARVRDRGQVIGEAMSWLARWSLRLALIAVGATLLWLLLAQLWVIVLPVLLAVLIATVLWPPTAWLRRHRFPPTLAATTVLLSGLTLFAGTFALLAPSVINEFDDIVSGASGGLQQIRQWFAGLPVNLGQSQLDAALQAVRDQLQQSASSIATGLLTGVTAVASAVLTAVLTLVLLFLFLKDGPRFLPWVRRVVGRRVGPHAAEVLDRMWRTLQGFITTQALIGLIDAVLIGIGLIIVGIPLALPLAVLTFIGGFVPIAGAIVAGGLAVLVALVSNGFTTALIVLAIVVGVQQVEGNLLQPILQGRRLDLHAAVVILAVTAGSSLYGISGAFLAVPVVAAAAAALRYLSALIDAETDAEFDHEGGEDFDMVSGDGGTAATSADAPSGQRRPN
ncbi:MAG: AI-2E family transporter [Actinomycetota bacterium]|nr:AI-2E family transporter [Actinomycetota bacterium]